MSSGLPAFKRAMEYVYGSFTSISNPKSWSPPPNSGGHKGRYLWTDAFGVLDFLTLHTETTKETSASPYLTLAERLVTSVHSSLGYTRDGSSRLPGATDAEPLKGGLRIGKENASGIDCDGQYHHYLTLWMFALNRLSLAKKDSYYNDQAISLAKAIHPHFFIDRKSSAPRMVWKVSTDLNMVLVNSEGNLDPIDGYVTFKILQTTAKAQHWDDPEAGKVLEEEIGDYWRVMQRKGKLRFTSDALDLGMAAWTAHWLDGREEWATELLETCKGNIDELYTNSKYFHRPVSLRIAFREFGTCVGIQCALASQETMDKRRVETLRACSDHILIYWSDKLEHPEHTPPALRPISHIMYAAAMIPGAFQAGYFGPETLENEQQ